MSEPVIADKKPSVLELEPGTYHWCSCGRSSKQPFCDGSHKGTDFIPMIVVIKAKEKKAFCNCKKTGTPPWCDGTHKNL